tara:strand:+ start:42 stop:803 length:762 start_codon:yes stop_codon:yes gene_type:complete
MKSFSQHAYDRDHELALMENFMREGINDPGIFKAFFTAGGPGSGKSFVAQNIGAGGRGRGMSPYGLKVIDSDPLFKKLLRDANMAADEKTIWSDAGQAKREMAKSLTKKQQAGFIEGRLGLLIDGTGKDFPKIKKQSDALRNIGYDTFMLFVNTSLEVAIERDKNRDRVLGEEEVTKMWKAVQSNMGKFQSYFGRESFILIDNNNVAAPVPRGAAWEKGIFDKLYVEIGKLIRTPPTSRAANAWMKSQRPSYS